MLCIGLPVFAGDDIFGAYLNYYSSCEGFRLTNILRLPIKKNQGACFGLKGNPVKIGSGPAAVIGDENR
jgi:hypothetical protein